MKTLSITKKPVVLSPVAKKANTWVELRQPPSDYAFNEALLLCEVRPDRWTAWVPGYGTIELDTTEFYAQ